MKVEYLSKFSKDLDKVNLPAVKKSIIGIIEDVKAANSINQIANIKKLVGFKSAYRIRVGQYRIGIFVDKNLVQFARIVHRKDIYKLFP
jgi:mRNA interferase RelE/StbE